MSSTHSAHHVQAIKANQPKRTGPEAMVITGQAIDEESRRNEEIQMEEGESMETQRLAAGADAKKKREETERKKKEEAEKQREKEEKERKKKVKKAAEKKQKADDKAERDAEKKRKEARRKADEARKKEAERLKKEGAVAEREARARRRAQRAAADEQPDENRENKKPPGMIVAAIQGVGKGLKAGVTKIGKAAKAVADKTCLAGQRTPSPARTPPSPVTFSFLDRAPVLSDTELLKSENNGHNGPHNHGYTRGTRHHPCDMLTFSSDYDLTARTCDDPCPSPQSVTSVVYAPQRIYVSEEQRRRNEEFEQALRPESDVLRKIAQWAKEEEEEEREEEERRREKTREKRRGEAERREMRRQHEAGTVKAVPVADPLGENSVVVRTSSTAVSSPPSSQEQHQQDQPVASPVTFDWIDENGAIPDKDQSGSPATFIRPRSDRTSIYTEYSRFSQWGSTISSQPNGSDRTALDRQSVVDSDANEAPDTSSPAPFAVPNGGAGSNLAILMTPGSDIGQPPANLSQDLDDLDNEPVRRDRNTASEERRRKQHEEELVQRRAEQERYRRWRREIWLARRRGENQLRAGPADERKRVLDSEDEREQQCRIAEEAAERAAKRRRQNHQIPMVPPPDYVAPRSYRDASPLLELPNFLNPLHTNAWAAAAHNSNQTTDLIQPPTAGQVNMSTRAPGIAERADRQREEEQAASDRMHPSWYPRFRKYVELQKAQWNESVLARAQKKTVTDDLEQPREPANDSDIMMDTMPMVALGGEGGSPSGSSSSSSAVSSSSRSSGAGNEGDREDEGDDLEMEAENNEEQEQMADMDDGVDDARLSPPPMDAFHPMDVDLAEGFDDMQDDDAPVPAPVPVLAPAPAPVFGPAPVPAPVFGPIFLPPNLRVDPADLAALVDNIVDQVVDDEAKKELADKLRLGLSTIERQWAYCVTLERCRALKSIRTGLLSQLKNLLSGRWSVWLVVEKMERSERLFDKAVSTPQRPILPRRARRRV